jgi:hypothetical protein
MGRTVNPLSFDFGGSNPPLPTLLNLDLYLFDFKKSKKELAEVAHLVER